MAGVTRATLRFGFWGFISMTREKARGMTATGVGSGALLGLWSEGRRDIAGEVDAIRLPDRFHFFAGAGFTRGVTSVFCALPRSIIVLWKLGPPRILSALSPASPILAFITIFRRRCLSQTCAVVLPNVKDEPRPARARLVQQ